MTITLEAPAPAPAVDIIVAPDAAVLALSVRLHDQKCAGRDRCPTREWHALDSHGRTVRNFLAVMADARRAGEI